VRLAILAKRTAVFAVVAIFSTAVAWADKPVSYAYSIPIEGEFFDCEEAFGMGFQILGGWTYNEYGREHYDKDGKLVRINGFFFNTDRLAHNSGDEEKRLEDGVNMVGAPEHAHFVVKFDDEVGVYYKESGINFKATVPGYGNVVMAAGTLVFESEDGINWVPTKITKNLDVIEDYYSMCLFLQ